jgi:hypothetical protein
MLVPHSAVAPPFLYPSWLATERLRVNDVIRERIRHYLSDPFLLDHVEQCVLPGRKIRSILLLKTLSHVGPSVDPSLPVVRDLVVSIELNHAASVLVDDVLDGDHFRHGSAATQRVWGSNTAILFGHLLSGVAIGALSSYPDHLANLLAAYRATTIGEMYDTFVIPSESPSAGYGRHTWQKTSSLFEFSLKSAGIIVGLPDQTRQTLSCIGEKLGHLYQLSNDHADWQVGRLSERHLEDEAWPITFSFPLAVYLALHGDLSIRSFLKRRTLSFESWHAFLEIIWCPEVASECLRQISSVTSEICDLSRRGLPVELGRYYRDMANLIQDESFWFHEYNLF